MGTPQAPALVKAHDVRVYAEIGILHGNTVELVSASLRKYSTVHLFDYEDKVKKVSERLSKKYPDINYVPHPSSKKTRDSYNWPLMKLLQDNPKLRFDYVYLDGAHTFEVDGLAFHLIDRFLNPGAFIELDDYDWTHRASIASYKKQVDAAAGKKLEEFNVAMFTEEQLSTSHTKLIVDLLIRTMPNYQELVPNRVFRKTDSLVPKGSHQAK